MGGKVLNAQAAADRSDAGAVVSPQLVLCELRPDSHGLESLSPFCLKIHRALKFYGLDYQRRYAIRPDEHKKYNPIGQVPVLLIDGRPVPDSTAILHALEGLADKTLLPCDPRERASAWLWEDYADGVLGYYAFAARWFDDRNWAALAGEHFQRLPALLKPWVPNLIRRQILKKMSHMEFIRIGQQGCWERFQRHLDMLEERVPEKGFWLGETMTVADIGLFGVLHSLRSDMSPWQMKEINRRPRMRAWLDRIDAVTRTQVSPPAGRCP